MPTYKLQPRSKITLIYRGEPIEFEAIDEDHAEELIEEFILDYGELQDWDVNYEEIT